MGSFVPANFDDHAVSIAKRQYMQEGDEGHLGMFRRVAAWVGSPESEQNRAYWTEKFYELMASKHFCPGGRVLAGAATAHGNVLNCFVQGATEHDPSSFEGVLEVARKLALVTKVGGGNGVNLDPYVSRRLAGQRHTVRGFAYLSANHQDVQDFIQGLMRPPTNPDGEKEQITVRNWTRVVYGLVSPELAAQARRHGVLTVREKPAGTMTVPDDMGGIIDSAREAIRMASKSEEPHVDFSSLRPEGAPIKGSGGTSSGPVSFLMEIYDNFLEWGNLGAEKAGPVATLRYVYSPVLRVVRQGGCLHPDTLVNTSQGTLRLRELADPFTYGWRNHALEVATDEGWKHSPQSYNNGIADTLKITLENGLELQGTPNHKLKVMRPDGSREWVRFDELNKEDWVIQVLDQHTGGSVMLAPLGEGSTHFNAKEIKTPEVLNEQLALWLGYLWGDGFVSDGRVDFAVGHNSPMIEKAPRLFRDLFGLEVYTEQKPNDASLVYVTKSSALMSWLSQNQLLKGKARTLEIPRPIRQAPRNVLAAFLRGLFEADGAITAGYPMLTTASKQLAQDALVMLAGLGIPAKLVRYNPIPGRYSKNEHYRVRVMTALGLERWLERVGYVEGSRFATLREFKPDTRRESSWPLPHAQGLLQAAFDSLTPGRKGHASVYTQTRKNLSRYLRNERQLTATGYTLLKSDPNATDLIPEFDFGEYYVQVRDITPGGRILTLDISVDDNHTYLAGGVVSHNTRRGAGMATIAIDHPDLLDFLTAKDLDREAAEGDISTFNISILATEKFWNTLQGDGLWNVEPAEVPGKYYPVQVSGEYTGKLPELKDREVDGARPIPVFAGGVPARWIWHEIAWHAWATGEPGLIFVDRINELSALKTLGTRYQIRSTNPCFVAGTKVFYQPVQKVETVPSGFGLSFLTPPMASVSRERSAPIETLVGQEVEVWDGIAREWYKTSFRVTGENQPVSKIEFTNGHSVTATPYHTFYLLDSTPIEVRDLIPGDRLRSTTHRLNPTDMPFEVKSVTDAGIADKVYCCTVEPHHRFTLENGLISKNCGEIPLTIGEPCDLGAINLAAYVHEGKYGFDAFRQDVRTCIRFLDNVLDVNHFALEDNRIASQTLRRLGLGVMGLADMLIKLGLPYSSQAGRDMVSRVMEVMREETIAESENLGKERGVFPVYKQNKAAMEKLGIAPRRNVAVLTVAPTGTTSMLMGVSSGIEPMFSPFMWRRIGGQYKALLHPLFVELLDQFPATDEFSNEEGKWNWDKLVDAIQANHGTVKGLQGIPSAIANVFEGAHDVPPLDHVRMQGVVQRAFDAEGLAANSLSKTINLPNGSSVEDVENAYSEAYLTGCKGITVYRDGSRQFQVLSVSKDEKKEEKKAEEHDVTQPALLEVPATKAEPTLARNPESPMFERTGRLVGYTDMVKLTAPDGTRRGFLVTVNLQGDHPVEVILTSGKAGDEANADSEALGRVISKALQYGVPVNELIKTMRGINGGLYGNYQGRFVTSKADLIAVALETNVKVKEEAQPKPAAEAQAPFVAVARHLDGDNMGFSLEARGFSLVSKGKTGLGKCPECGDENLVREEGCTKCYSCGYSKCG